MLPVHSPCPQLLASVSLAGPDRAATAPHHTPTETRDLYTSDHTTYTPLTARSAQPASRVTPNSRHKGHLIKVCPWRRAKPPRAGMPDSRPTSAPPAPFLPLSPSKWAPRAIIATTRWSSQGQYHPPPSQPSALSAAASRWRDVRAGSTPRQCRALCTSAVCLK